MKELKITMMKLDDLHPYENNPRENAAAVPRVAASIKEFGFKSEKENIEKELRKTHKCPKCGYEW